LFFSDQKEVSYLGFILTPNGINYIMQGQTQNNSESTKTKKRDQNHSLLGTLQFFSNSIKNFTCLLHLSMTLLEEKKLHKNLSKEYNYAFDNLKKTLYSEPAMS
jgi:hypothetical protein